MTIKTDKASNQNRPTPSNTEKTLSMRRHIIISLLMLLAITAGSIYAKEKAEIAFSTTSHDFGRISADGGKVSCKYEFTNKGKEQLVIIHVTNGGCGCTTPTFTR